ncbi:hypothetical protein D3C75_839770 [compost metagenome]
MLKVLFSQPPLKKSSRVIAWCRMRLIEDQVATKSVAPRSEEMVKTNLEQISRTRVAGDMTTQVPICLVSTYDHG